MLDTLVYATDKTMDNLVIDWHDEMTDDTFAEMFAETGAVRDVDYMRNREAIARHFGFGMVSA